MSRHYARLGPLIALVALASGPAPSRGDEAPSVERWGLYEVELKGPRDGNPFIEVDLVGRFTHGERSVRVAGFYDGDGTYRVRFMPDAEGEWRYETASNRPELDGKAGRFTATRPTGNNHGPVRVSNRFHFAYADGTPHYSFGTTCYAWNHQPEALEEQTLATLAKAPFNKMRMCVFPKYYRYNKADPPRFPYEKNESGGWDLARFNPDYFRHLEERVGDLRDLGIEADLILFHPYDVGHWGFDRMPPDADDRYLRYMLARLSAYRNVWWSLANEFDFMKEKKPEDWDRFAEIVVAGDPYVHLRSIHNGTRLYNLTKPWVTHASIQNGSAVADFGRAILYRDVYEKPVVFDEAKYEGDIPERWGNLSAEEMVHRFWQGIIAGTYVGHGETYQSPDEILWWSKGGVLKGGSPPRIGFLRRIVEDAPPGGLEPIDKWQTDNEAGQKGLYYLVYLGKDAPKSWPVELPASRDDKPVTLQIDLIDTWGMTTTPVDGTFTFKPRPTYGMDCEDRPSIELPGKPYMAIRLRKVP